MNEIPASRTRRQLVFSIKLAAAIIGASLLLTLARRLGWLDADQVVRAFNIALGLMFAVYGNAMPKMLEATPPRSLGEATVAQAIARVSGWAMTLAFLVWAALWTFAPKNIALFGGIAAVVAGVAVMACYAVRKASAMRKSGNA